jgi:hypothetical protein
MLYGNHVYSVQQSLGDTRARFWRLIRLLLFVSIGIFIGRQLIGIPFSFLDGLARNMMDGSFSPPQSMGQVFLENDLIQALMVFGTGLITVIMTFFKELRQIFFSK